MSTKQNPNPRPWYCSSQLVDAHRSALETGVMENSWVPDVITDRLQLSVGGDLKMLRALKTIRSIFVIATIGAISLYTLYLGADPTLVAMLSLPGLAAYAGIEAADYAALVQAYREVKQDTDDGEQK